MDLKLKRIFWYNQNDVTDLQALFETGPDYAEKIYGTPLVPEDEAIKNLKELPPGRTLEDKHFLLFYHPLLNIPVACMDLMRGYPNPHTTFIGLLQVHGDYRQQGIGECALNMAIQYIVDWKEIKTLRLSYLSSNASVGSFWRHMGFEATGEKGIYRHEDFQTEHNLMERQL